MVLYLLWVYPMTWVVSTLYVKMLVWWFTTIYMSYQVLRLHYMWSIKRTFCCRYLFKPFIIIKLWIPIELQCKLRKHSVLKKLSLKKWKIVILFPIISIYKISKLLIKIINFSMKLLLKSRLLSNKITSNKL